MLTNPVLLEFNHGGEPFRVQSLDVANVLSRVGAASSVCQAAVIEHLVGYLDQVQLGQHEPQAVWRAQCQAIVQRLPPAILEHARDYLHELITEISLKIDAGGEESND